jgi:DNA-directed RNA polymerase subunit RPC12/RpoP
MSKKASTGQSDGYIGNITDYGQTSEAYNQRPDTASAYYTGLVKYTNEELKDILFEQVRTWELYNDYPFQRDAFIFQEITKSGIGVWVIPLSSIDEVRDPEFHQKILTSGIARWVKLDAIRNCFNPTQISYIENNDINESMILAFNLLKEKTRQVACTILIKRGKRPCDEWGMLADFVKFIYKCAHCGAESGSTDKYYTATSLNRCERCQHVFFCPNTDCQKTYERIHKFECKSSDEKTIDAMRTKAITAFKNSYNREERIGHFLKKWPNVKLDEQRVRIKWDDTFIEYQKSSSSSSTMDEALDEDSMQTTQDKSNKNKKDKDTKNNKDNKENNKTANKPVAKKYEREEMKKTHAVKSLRVKSTTENKRKLYRKILLELGASLDEDGDVIM